jgi:hypothetical protein
MRIEVTTFIDEVDFKQGYGDRVTGEIDGAQVDGIDLMHLKLNKRASGRHRDLDDLENLPSSSGEHERQARAACQRCAQARLHEDLATTLMSSKTGNQGLGIRTGRRLVDSAEAASSCSGSSRKGRLPTSRPLARRATGVVSDKAHLHLAPGGADHSRRESQGWSAPRPAREARHVEP